MGNQRLGLALGNDMVNFLASLAGVVNVEEALSVFSVQCSVFSSLLTDH
ncbi:MAG: hypothetical protein KKD28_01685 [Chloroflexi bacterium]|nr:hypothetical protein [Chloroflexota bacterium]